MPTVRDFIKKVESIDVKSLVKAAAFEHEHEIINLNREDQIFQKGIDSKGVPLLDYAPTTQGKYDAKPPLDLKGENKASGKEYNLFWSGDSYYGFYMYMKGDKLYITTNRRGRKHLLKWGGEDIFGLTEENTLKVNNDIIAPTFNEKVKKILL